MRGRLLFVLIGAACLVATGCASGPTPHLSASAPSEDARASLAASASALDPRPRQANGTCGQRGCGRRETRGIPGRRQYSWGIGPSCDPGSLGPPSRCRRRRKAEPAEVVEEAEAVIKSSSLRLRSMTVCAIESYE